MSIILIFIQYYIYFIFREVFRENIKRTKKEQ